MTQGTLIIKRKLRKTPLLKDYQELFKLQGREDKIGIYLRQRELTEEWRGKMIFTTDKSGVFIEHYSNDVEQKSRTQLSYSSIPDGWLLAFSFSDMQVIGLDLGVFQAETTVEKALRRLQHVELPFGSEIDRERGQIYRFLERNGHDEDRIKLSTDWLYYRSEDQMLDFEAVKKDINEQVRRVKNSHTVPYWTNRNDVQKEVLLRQLA